MKNQPGTTNHKNQFSTPMIQDETIESLSAKLLKATAELTAANKRLQQVQKEREEIISNLSHDLRAPITAIRSALDYLNTSSSLTIVDYQSTLAMIDRRTRTLEDLIQDMYYLFCVEDTSKELRLTEIEIAPFLEEYYYDTLADSRFDTHEVNLELPPGLNCRVRIDVQKMVRVLDNLFTNAVKYTQKDSAITLRAEISPSDKMLAISVIDNGPGIPAEAVTRVFNRTYTVSSARTPGSTSGSGLGLTIVKAIMERHGGTAVCTSEEGKGCCFTLTLPTLTCDDNILPKIPLNQKNRN